MVEFETLSFAALTTNAVLDRKIQFPFMATHPPVRLMPPAKVEVPVPKAAKAPPERMSPVDSMTPAVVVARPTPKPPVR